MCNQLPTPEEITSDIRNSKQPIFEIFLNSNDRVYIYYDGQVKGLSGVNGIVNWYPALHATLEARLRLAQKESTQGLPRAASPSEAAPDKDGLHNVESDRDIVGLSAA
jgi:hypothetical protein